MTEEKSAVVTAQDIVVFWVMEFGTKNFTLFNECAKRLKRYKFVHAASTPNPRAFQADIIENIARADYVIADVSDQNLNVALELGIAETFNKKTIMIAKEIKLPSDITQYRTIKYSTEFNGVDKLCTEIDDIISRDLLGEIKFSNLVKDHMPKGFVKIISEAVQFYCQNGDIEDFYRRFIEAQAVKFKGMPQFYNPTSNIEADPLGNTAESYKNAKKILLEARKYGELFYALMLPECQTLFFLNQQFSYSNNKRILHRLVADDGVLALERLKAENFIEYRETTGDDVSSLIKILEPYVLLMPPADGIAKHCYYGCVITKKGLNYCEKHRDDLATEPSEK